MTRDEYMNALRLRLNDETATRWSDDELVAYLQESVERYSKLFPDLKEQEGACDGVSSIYDVPDDLVDNRIHKAWLVQEHTLKEISSYAMRPRRSSRYFEVVDDKIMLGFVPTATDMLRVRYSALYYFPETGSENMTTPSEDNDMIYLWAEHLAWRKIAGSDASLSRWKEQGKRDDGPIIPHYVMLERQYTNMVREKKAGGRFLVRVRQEPRFRLPGWNVNY